LEKNGMISFLVWDPDRVAFIIPLINREVVWYGILFAIGFYIGFYLLQYLLKRFLCFYPEFSKGDILDWKALTENHAIKGIDDLNKWLDLEKLPFSAPHFSSSITRLLRFAKKRLDEKAYRRIKNRLFLEHQFPQALKSLKSRVLIFSERLTFYIIIGTVVGARLGHILFYEQLSFYLAHPLDIFKVWEGGLASHGAIIGMLCSITFCYLRSRKEYPMISIVRIIDLLVVPSLFAGCLIRIGNFMNQEILGTATSLPWAIVFGHPADGSVPIPRHPAQLYEAVGYFWGFLLFLNFLGI